MTIKQGSSAPLHACYRTIILTHGQLFDIVHSIIHAARATPLPIFKRHARHATDVCMPAAGRWLTNPEEAIINLKQNARRMSRVLVHVVVTKCYNLAISLD